MTLTIESRTLDRIPLSWRGFTPACTAHMTLRAIEQQLIAYGNSQIAMGEVFKVSGDPSDGDWRLEGDFGTVHHVGMEMNGGTIHATGPLGRHAGSGMLKGRIVADQEVGDHLGSEMRGGYISVSGNAGDHVGAGYIGSKSGMRGGTIVVEGNVGSHAGHLMRRGTLVVAGDCGDWPAYRMRGGTLVIGGTCGARPGAELRRGTIVLAGKLPALLPTFRYACRLKADVITLLERELASLNVNLPLAPSPTVAVYNGDINEGGRGELLIPLDIEATPAGREGS